MPARRRTQANPTMIIDSDDPPPSTPGQGAMLPTGDGIYAEGTYHFNEANSRLWLATGKIPFSNQEVELVVHKGEPDGYAGLDSSGLVPAEQIDGNTIQKTEEKGEPDGYAGLDGDGYVPEEQLPPGARWRAIRKTSSQSTTSASLQTDSELTFPVETGLVYAFRFWVLFSSEATTTGIGLALSVPSFTVFSATSRIPESGNLAIGYHTADDDVRVGTSVPVVDTTYLAMIEGIIRPLANGDVTLRFRSEVGGSEVTVALHSFVEYQQIP